MSDCAYSDTYFDLAVKIEADDNFSLGEANEYKIIVTNNQTANEMIYFSLEKGIYNELSSFNTYKRNININNAKETRYFQWTPSEEGGFEICTRIYNFSGEDLDENNNRACKNITVVNHSHNSTNNTDIAQDERENPDIPLDENESEEVLNQTDAYGNSCDISVSVRTDKGLYYSGEKIGIFIDVKDENKTEFEKQYTLSYWIEDLFGNVIKKRYENNYSIDSEGTDTRKYGPSAPDIGDSEAYLIRAMIINSTCNDTYNMNNMADAMIVVRGNQNESDAENKSQSYIRITEIPSGHAKFGDVIYAEIEVYRGDTSKYSATIRIERPSDGYDVSEKTKIQFKEKYTKYVLNIPIQIKPNCNGRYKSGTYNIILEGLGAEDSKDMKISGISDSLCMTETKTVTKYVYKNTETQTSLNTANAAASVGSGAESKEKKKKDIELEIVSFEDNVCFNSSFTTGVMIENNADVNKTIFVYSYVISGKTRLSDGRGLGGWVKSWTGNRVELTIAPEEIIDINLTNRIAKNITGNFSFRIKIKGDLEDMIERNISILPADFCRNDSKNDDNYFEINSTNKINDYGDDMFSNLDDQYSKYNTDTDYRMNENNIGFKITSKNTDRSFFGRILDKIINSLIWR